MKINLASMNKLSSYNMTTWTASMITFFPPLALHNPQWVCILQPSIGL